MPLDSLLDAGPNEDDDDDRITEPELSQPLAYRRPRDTHRPFSCQLYRFGVPVGELHGTVRLLYRSRAGSLVQLPAAPKGARRAPSMGVEALKAFASNLSPKPRAPPDDEIAISGVDSSRRGSYEPWRWRIKNALFGGRAESPVGGRAESPVGGRAEGPVGGRAESPVFGARAGLDEDGPAADVSTDEVRQSDMDEVRQSDMISLEIDTDRKTFAPHAPPTPSTPPPRQPELPAQPESP